MRIMPSSFVIFTDLDGTLLDYGSYSFSAALPSLRIIESRNIPLVICTSKTRAEIESYRRLLGNREPFISENGGGIFIPEGYFPFDFEYDKRVDGYHVIEIGTPHGILVEALESIKRDTGVEVRGLSGMTIEEISDVSGLTREMAELAKVREYDEPFLVYGGKEEIHRIKEEIARRGLNHIEGGIFHHITGNNDKGKAVGFLLGLFKRGSPGLRAIGIGDSPNDIPMLDVVDIPVLVQRPGGGYDKRIKHDNLVLADGIGPEGWNRAVLDLCKRP